MQNVSGDQDSQHHHQPHELSSVAGNVELKEEIILFVYKSVYQFSLLSGHNFPSLNPSISDKKNIQTLAKDSGKWVGISLVHHFNNL